MITSVRGLASHALKIGVSLLFVAYLVQAAPWDEVWRHVRGASMSFLALYVLLGVVATLISARKWQVLATARGIAAGFPYLTALYFVGYFFNNFLPTSMGGDVVRGYALGKSHDRPADAMASVFLERFTGYATLVLFGLLVVVMDPAIRGEPRFVAPILVAALVLAAVAVALVSTSWLAVSGRLVPAGLLRRLISKLEALQHAIHLYRHEPRAIVAAGAYSILFYVVSVVTLYVGCRTFGAEVPLPRLLAATPVLLILVMIPFSLGGIGLQEWAYYFVLVTLGVPAPISVSLALLFRTRSIAFGLVGGAIYPFVTHRPERAGADVSDGLASTATTQSGTHV